MLSIHVTAKVLPQCDTFFSWLSPMVISDWGSSATLPVFQPLFLVIGDSRLRASVQTVVKTILPTVQVVV